MPQTSRGEITELLSSWSGGDRAAHEELMARVYSELRRLAGSFLNQEQQSTTMDTVGLVTEAYLKLIDQNQTNWQNRAHFFAIAGQIMRRILVDHARRRGAVRHGHGLEQISLADAERPLSNGDPNLIALDEGLQALALLAPEQAKIVELRFFGGLARHEIAEVVGCSSATVARRWRTARIWLLHYLEKGEALDASPSPRGVGDQQKIPAVRPSSSAGPS